METPAARDLADRIRLALPLAVFVLAVAGLALLAGRLDLAVYGLSFWHYPVYALAFCFRAVTVDRFRDDAALLKTASLVLLALVLWRTAPNPVVFAVMAAGFGLNMAAAARLGSDRTYYGVELANLPVRRTSAFPYSLMAHPMLVGNMIAYGAPLLDGNFRAGWWPLALIHVVLNFLVLVMEVRGEVHGPGDRRTALARISGGIVAGSAILLISFANLWHFGLAVVFAGLAFGAVLVRRYSRGAPAIEARSGKSSHD